MTWRVYGQDESQKPQWVSDLIESGMLQEVHKFSKFIHGCAVLLPEEVRASSEDICVTAHGLACVDGRVLVPACCARCKPCPTGSTTLPCATPSSPRGLEM